MTKRKPLSHEIVDQILHASYGLLTMISIPYLGVTLLNWSGWIIALIIFVPVTVLALWRESKQHPHRSFWKLFNIDIQFVIIGQIIGTGVAVFL